MAEINTDQEYPNVVVSILDPEGRPAKVDGVPVWTSSDETVLLPVPNPDGLGGKVTTVAPGVARITITADADLGAGVETKTGVSEDVTVTQGPSTKASTFVINFGTPVNKAA